MCVNKSFCIILICRVFFALSKTLMIVFLQNVPTDQRVWMVSISIPAYVPRDLLECSVKVIKLFSVQIYVFIGPYGLQKSRKKLRFDGRQSE